MPAPRPPEVTRPRRPPSPARGPRARPVGRGVEAGGARGAGPRSGGRRAGGAAAAGAGPRGPAAPRAGAGAGDVPRLYRPRGAPPPPPPPPRPLGPPRLARRPCSAAAPEARTLLLKRTGLDLRDKAPMCDADLVRRCDFRDRQESDDRPRDRDRLDDPRGPGRGPDRFPSVGHVTQEKDRDEHHWLQARDVHGVDVVQPVDRDEKSEWKRDETTGKRDPPGRAPRRPRRPPGRWRLVPQTVEENQWKHRIRNDGHASDDRYPKPEHHRRSVNDQCRWNQGRFAGAETSCHSRRRVGSRPEPV